MNSEGQLCVRLIHCGNRNIANPKDNSPKNAFYMPMGLFPLASILKQNGVDVEIINLDLAVGHEIEEILDLCTLDAVGLDCHWVNQSLAVLDTAKLIKRASPGVFVFLGGFTASFFAEEIMSEHPSIDAIIRGDGEIPVVELCRILFSNIHDESCQSMGFNDVPNLVWRNDDNELILNEFSYVATAQDMDHLEFAEVDLLRDWDLYRDLCTFCTEFSPIGSFPQFFLEVGRGCSYACSFCGGSFEAQRKMCNRNRPAIRSVDSVIRTIWKAVSFGFSLFYASLQFEGSEKWYTELFRRMREEELDIAFGYGCDGIPSKSLVDTISESCSWAVIEITPESGVPELRRRNKDSRLFYTNAELEQCLEYIGTKDNIRVLLFFGYYLPFETAETIFATLGYVTKLFSKYSRFVQLVYDNLPTDPGSPLYSYPEKYGVDMKVRSFGDYLASLEEYYLLREDHLPILTLFKPRSISEWEIDDLGRKIQLLQHLISDFPKSTLILIKESGSTSVIAEYLRELDLSSFRVADDARNVLLSIGEERGVLDAELLNSIGMEHEQRQCQRDESAKPVNSGRRL